MEDIHVFPTIQHAKRVSPFIGEAPAPYPWAPKFLPEQWIYTDGSDITGHPRLGATVVHIPTNTTIYIDAAGTEETHTITRAELVAIHTALSTYATHDWIGILTDSLSNLQAIRHHQTNPGTTSAKHYHHHSLLLGSIADLLETRRRAGLSTTILTIRGPTNIRGNDFADADAAAKLAVTHYETLPPPQIRRVEIGEIAPVQFTGSCTRLTHRHHYRPYPIAPCHSPPPMVDHPGNGMHTIACVHAPVLPTRT